MPKPVRSKVPCARCGRIHTHNCKPSALQAATAARRTADVPGWARELLADEDLDPAAIGAMLRTLDDADLTRRLRVLQAVEELHTREIQRRRPADPTGLVPAGVAPQVVPEPPPASSSPPSPFPPDWEIVPQRRRISP